MTDSTQMTEQAATTPEGSTASQTAESSLLTAGEQSAEQQQAAEGQDTQTDSGKSEADNGEGKGAEGAPEKYEFQIPEGAEVDEAGLAAFSNFAKKANLSQEAAQALLSEMAPAMAQAQAEKITQIRNEWAESTRVDKEFGGEKLGENLAVAKKALETFGTPELRTLLDQTGLGNHPEIVRAFYRAGKAISEDTFVTGRADPKGAQSMAQRMYPNMNP